MPYSCGVHIFEIPTSITAPIESDSAIVVAVGTAPINQLEKPMINEPVIAYNYKEAVEKMGFSKDFKHYTLSEVIDVMFSKFAVGPLIMINVLDPKEHKERYEDIELNVIDRKVTIGEEGVLLDSIIVKDSTESITYQLGIDYEVTFNSSYYAIIHILPEGSASNEFTVKVSYDKLDPTLVTSDDIIGGYDNIEKKYKGLECISQVYSKLGVIPGQIIAPGFSQRPVVAAVMRAKTENISGLFRATTVVDIDSSETGAESYDMVYEWKTQNSYFNENMICCYPMVKIGDTPYHFSTVWAAMTAKTDAQNMNVPYVSPSNKDLPITGLVTESGKTVYLDLSQASMLNGYGVCTAINMNGWKTRGDNTSIYPSSTDVKDRFIPERRMFSWWGNNLILTYFQKVDSPMNRRLIDAIVDSENIKANGYVARGMIAGARVEFKESENPVTNLINGNLCFHLYLTPFPPAETIDFTLEFDPDMLQTALS